MQLELEDGTILENPGEREIEQALETLVRQENNFAILSQHEMTYIQTARFDDVGYLLEYQAGETEDHYRVPEPVPIQVVVAAFKNYASGNQAWNEDHEWQRGTHEVAEQNAGCTGAILAFLAAVIGASGIATVVLAFFAFANREPC